jgi:hypothetical protein
MINPPRVTRAKERRRNAFIGSDAQVALTREKKLARGENRGCRHLLINIRGFVF